MLELLYIILSTITGITRDYDPALAQIAQERSAAIVCASDEFWTHSGKPDDVAEILTCFPNSGDVAQKAADAWRNSAPHWAVLTNTGYHAIGCGATVTGDSILVACELAPGRVPNTALPVTEGLLTAAGLLLVVMASAVYRSRRFSRS